MMLYADILKQHQDAQTRIIAWDKHRTFSLADFQQYVFSLYQLLQQYPQKKWAICFDNSFFFSAALFALIYSNKIPIIPGHTREALLAEQQADFDGILTDLSLNLTCAQINTNDICLLNLADAQKLATQYQWPTDAQLILFTSGSTAKPEPIHKSLCALQAESQLLASQWGEQLTQAVFIASVSHQHLYGLTFRILLPLSLGRPFYAQMTQFHENVLALAMQYPAQTVFITSPAFLKRLDTQLHQAPLNMMFSAGGPLHFAEAQQAKAMFGVLPTEIYGSSETGVIAHRKQRCQNQVWSLFAGINISITKDHALLVQSALCEETCGAILKDKIQIEQNGFHIIGRTDRIIKLEEKRISLTEITHRLLCLPQIADVALCTLEHNNRTVLGAVIVLEAQTNRASTAHLIQQFTQALRPYVEPVAVPKRWRFVQDIPVNTQGKRNFHDLQELFK
ncbi:AMP-binding protein [Neisseria sp. Ec49-e6-T10]|uniref:AMP-binding protein n=1 Tax=Neisseria sp. Ec49-e6-T10 TaxID=3140744 RepID=UPI003EBEF45C